MNRNNARFNLRTLEDNLQTMLENVLQNYFNPAAAQNVTRESTPANLPIHIPEQRSEQTPDQGPVPIPNTNNRNQTYVEQMSILHTIRELTQAYNLNMRDYNSNMRDYNSNIATALQLVRNFLQEQVNEDIYRVNTQPNTRSRNDTRSNARQPNNINTNANPETTQRTPNPMPNIRIPILTYTIFPTSTNNAARQALYENVVVRPSNEQIEEATERLVYSPDMILINTRCPISLEDFVEGEEVVRINHCGHTFRETSINNWFESNVRCPVCRHDIRDTIGAATIDSQENSPENINRLATDTSNNVTSEYFQSYIQNIMSLLDSSNNIQEYHDIELVAEVSQAFDYSLQYDVSGNLEEEE
jgi:hypothetical protein